MISIEEFIDILSVKFNKHFVFRRVSRDASSTFKGIKEYTFELWVVGNTYPTITANYTINNCSNVDELHEAELAFIKKIINYAFKF